MEESPNSLISDSLTITPTKKHHNAVAKGRARKREATRIPLSYGQQGQASGRGVSCAMMHSSSKQFLSDCGVPYL